MLGVSLGVILNIFVRLVWLLRLIRRMWYLCRFKSCFKCVMVEVFVELFFRLNIVRIWYVFLFIWCGCFLGWMWLVCRSICCVLINLLVVNECWLLFLMIFVGKFLRFDMWWWKVFWLMWRRFVVLCIVKCWSFFWVLGGNVLVVCLCSWFLSWLDMVLNCWDVCIMFIFVFVVCYFFYFNNFFWLI